MSPMEETQSPVRGNLFRGRAAQTRRIPLLFVLALIALGAAAALAIAIRPNTTAAFWTATSVIKIGKVPNLDNFLAGTSPPQVELIENARDLALTISGPQFLAKVAAGLTTNDQQASSLLANLSLRALVLDDASLRLEMTATSKQDAISGLNESIALVQKTEESIVKPKLDQFQFVHDNLQGIVDWLAGLLKTDSAAQQLPQSFTGPVIVLGNNDRISDRMVDLKLRIGEMEAVQHLITSTGPVANLEPVLDGPRQTDVGRKALLAGLGALFCAIVLTFFVMNFLPQGAKESR